MVFEAIINPFKAEKQPWKLFFIGIIFTSIAIFLRIWIFKEESSMVIILLIVLVATPLVYETLKIEEKKDLNIEKESYLLKEHSKALMLFVFLFIGMMVSFAGWFILLPKDKADHIFKMQVDEIERINYPQTHITGNIVESYPIFIKIFLNNMKVLFFSLLFAFIFGSGTIFILTWNAALAGIAMGLFVKSLVDYSFLGSIGLSFLRYAIHGIPEILAYFTAGLAGGIISIAIVRHDLFSDKFKHIVIDSVDLSVLSVVILLIAALLEVFVTPMFFV